MTDTLLMLTTTSRKVVLLLLLFSLGLFVVAFLTTVRNAAKVFECERSSAAKEDASSGRKGQVITSVRIKEK